MNKLIPVLLAFGLVAAQAQSADAPAPITVRLYPTVGGGKLGIGLDAGLQRSKLGLRMDSGDWSIALALPAAPPAATQPWLTGLGASWKFSSATRLGLNYRLEASAVPEGPASRSLGLSYGYQFTSGLRLNTSLDRGLSDGAPKWGGGLSISFSH